MTWPIGSNPFPWLPGKVIGKVITFTIPGKAVGYYTHGARPNWKRANEYTAYKVYVQVQAIYAGLTLPLFADKDTPKRIDVTCYFKNGVHSDPENVRAGIVDALFYDKKRKVKGKGDKFAWGTHYPPRYDKSNPRVEVTVFEGEQC